MITLTANEGMWLTNGDVYGKIVRLPEGADADVWYAITDEEYLRDVEALDGYALIKHGLDG